ncbi:hypothetical protein VTP01DRAFT_905 [Rhizomucor pusillus]|uniref:uncharacterized protein n=1 Tax=Rhizomucor pusillus TaxID=4840 RepID=UPI003741EBE3
MSYIPSPPATPEPPSPPSLYSYLDDPDWQLPEGEPGVVCGECNKALDTDWFCSNCQVRCPVCNDGVLRGSVCSACWTYLPEYNIYIPNPRKFKHFYDAMVPSPTTSTTSNMTTEELPKPQ